MQLQDSPQLQQLYKGNLSELVVQHGDASDKTCCYASLHIIKGRGAAERGLTRIAGLNQVLKLGILSCIVACLAQYNTDEVLCIACVPQFKHNRYTQQLRLPNDIARSTSKT